MLASCGPAIHESALLWNRDLAAQQTDTEGRYFDERLRERESARKVAAERSSMEFERTRQYETDY